MGRKAGSVALDHARDVFSRLNAWGALAAAIFFVIGLTPSILPRTWYYQGLICGLAAGLGYLVGLGLEWLWTRIVRCYLAPRYRWLDTETWSPRQRTFTAYAFYAVLGIWVLAVTFYSVRWQRDVADNFSVPALSLPKYLLVLPVALAVFTALVIVARGLRSLVRALGRAIPGNWPLRRRQLIAAAVVAALGVYLLDSVIPGVIVRAGEKIFTAQNAEPDPVTRAPVNSERSGSPDSVIDFDGVGLQGSRFLNAGASRAKLERVTGRPAKEPIRAYAGLGNGATNTDRARLLIEELERTNATEREAILLVMTTGTGWISSYSAQGFELLYGGDTAVVATQYSAMPSAFHFLAGGEQVERAGQEFITPIVDWWNTLPRDDRPRLYLYGESLGTTGIEAAFSGVRDIANSVDGILLTGPPHFNRLRTQFVERRDPGTTEINPVYAGGLVVRFATTSAQAREWASLPEQDWGPTRMLYIQHTSDPVSWWSPGLAWREPDWMSEDTQVSRGSTMSWFPVITSLQVAADLPGAKNVPDGVGHNYGESVIDGFVSIAGSELAAERDPGELHRQFAELDVDKY
ncbi:alpha/beta hydrolase [Corynebacterium confusum]|uniref:alpha/beta hydrolase n=1 Tax=Corynebacterium confusum TaxID=71254 RepID=UPI0025B428B8|nr:alpha/beta hydrolase [Corynebacterium confusum]WJY89346.1 hypothetical protein CCONF_03975 [Corynebacterium confusum]